jgi:hypothetical protein
MTPLLTVEDLKRHAIPTRTGVDRGRTRRKSFTLGRESVSGSSAKAGPASRRRAGRSWG